MFESMTRYFPETVSKGPVRIEPFEVKNTPDLFFYNSRLIAQGLDPVRPGKYVRLIVGGHLMMSDTTMERRTNTEVVKNAQGDVLIAGLGIGMILVPILRKEEVRSVTVIEKSQEVIDLVQHVLPHQDKLTCICADIFTWKPPKGQKWDVVYFDIWPTITDESLEEMATLHRRFGKRKATWMNSWMKEFLLEKRREF